MDSVRFLIRRTGLRRHHIAAARLYCERNALSLFQRSRTSDPRILCYHSVGQPDYGVNDVGVALFRSQIEWALERGKRFVDPETIALGGGNEDDIAITFDDGLHSVLSTAAPILHDYGIPSICFVVTGWAAQSTDWARRQALDWKGVEELAEAGVQIGSHSVTHPDFATLSRQEALHELSVSRSMIEDRLGIGVRAFAIPLGQSNNWQPSFNQLAFGLGYRFVYAQSWDFRPEGTIARTFITSMDNKRRFQAALDGAFDRWEEWV